LRKARRESDGRVSARLIAIANALEGMDRASAARLAGMDRQTLRDWVHRYNAEGIAGLCNRPAPGRKPKLTEGQMAALKAVVLAGPDPAVDKIARWRIVDLRQWVKERWDVSYSETGCSDCCGRSTCRIGRPDRATRRAARRPNKPLKRGVCCPPDGNRAGPSGSRAV
jgi:transposase